MRKKLALVIPVFVFLAVSYLFFRQPIMNLCCAKEYTRFNHPNNDYTVVVYGTPRLFALPGSAGDAPGFVQLIDDQGKVLKEQETDMVQQIEQVSWSKNRVDIKLFASWPLEK